MPDFITLSCPSCGAKLQITNDIERFACGYCGIEHIVNRTGGIVTLKPMIESIQKVQVGVDKTASELAIVRINKEIGELELNVNQIINQPGTNVIFQGKLLYAYIALFILALFLASWKSTQVCSAILILTLLAFGVYAFLKGKNQDARNEKEAKPYIDRLNIKKKELAEHQAIVSKF